MNMGIEIQLDKKIRALKAETSKTNYMKTKPDLTDHEWVQLELKKQKDCINGC